MQLFGMHVDATLAAKQLGPGHCGSQIREAVQVVYCALSRLQKPIVEGFVRPDTGAHVAPYKDFNPHHPLVYWIMACEAHFLWALDHAEALGVRWSDEFGYGTHLCAHHVDHIRRQHGWSTLSGPSDLFAFDAPPTADEWAAWLPESKAKLGWRDMCATVRPPTGCKFGLMLMPDECYRGAPDARDWVASYQALYERKADTLGERYTGRAPNPAVVAAKRAAIDEVVDRVAKRARAMRASHMDV